MAKKTKIKFTKWGWLRLSKPSAIVAGAFVLIFAGVGLYVQNSSHAASSCRYGIYGSGSSGQCVTYILEMVNGAHA